ncbi:MAG: 2-C-methyl-D-erythritol 2,4-cyclodiphosphate synthase [Oscillospiraceae bacterium]|nr:2-C-methyl-D-erythritol 2,4-cyclodiphosphate synthase [Oscillospiraceae bacterium]
MIRIGHGYDVHRLVEGRRLILGGVQIPYEKGLLGHSDADVLSHAITDALLGALALPDIGTRFPDSDPKFKDADSIELLKNAYSEILSTGYSISNIDCTVIAEKPKLKPFIYPMRKVIAEALSTDISNVNIKATTEEGLGLRGEGIGAHAVVLLEK